jgi:hypothetical protein
MKKRYILIENKRKGKNFRFNVFDTILGCVVKGKLDKYSALGLEGVLNKKPHQKEK